MLQSLSLWLVYSASSLNCTTNIGSVDTTLHSSFQFDSHWHYQAWSDRKYVSVCVRIHLAGKPVHRHLSIVSALRIGKCNNWKAFPTPAGSTETRQHMKWLAICVHWLNYFWFWWWGVCCYRQTLPNGNCSHRPSDASCTVVCAPQLTCLNITLWPCLMSLFYRNWPSASNVLALLSHIAHSTPNL